MDVTADDERLLIEAAQADPARFLELYDRYVDRVYAYVSRRVGSRTVAEDVTSAVFERALTHLPRFEWRGAPFSAWLLQIAANALADHWKREGRSSPDPPPDVPDEREYQDLERRVSLFQLVDRLPETQRQVIQMRFVEERSIREVAAALDRSEGAVKQLQLRALENLRKGMEERPGGVPEDREERPGGVPEDREERPGGVPEDREERPGGVPVDREERPAARSSTQGHHD